MFALVLLGGAVAGLGARSLARMYETRKHPETASMTWAQRYRSGWAADRYSRRSWMTFGILFTAFGALELVVLAVQGSGAEKVVGVLGSVFFLGLASAAFVQAGRTSR
jgi:hypothetical protein